MADASKRRATRVLDFQIRAVQGAWVHRAGRYALSTVCPRAVESSSEVIKEAVQKLIDDRRKRVNRLRGLGLKQVQGKSWYFAMNCPPPGVVTQYWPLKTCNLRFCPFCWCRLHVPDLFHRLERIYYGRSSASPRNSKPLDESGWPTPKMIDLLEIRSSVLIENQGPKSVEMLFDTIHSRRRKLLDYYELGRIGAFQFHVIEPPDIRWMKPMWTYHLRILALLRPDTELPKTLMEPPEHGQRIVDRHVNVDRHKLATCTGRMCLFPGQLLYGCGQSTLDLLRGFDVFNAKDRPVAKRKGFRLKAYYGLLRNKASSEREDLVADL